MSLQNYSHEESKNLSMIELANAIMLDEKKAMNFKDVFEKIAEIKEFSDSDKEANIAQFYTDLNVDGRFITIGSNMWGLKRWYPVETMDEEVAAAPKKKKKTKKKKKEEESVDLVEEELDIVDEDIEEMADDFDDDEEDEFDTDLEEELDEEVDDDEFDDDSKDDKEEDK
ncbi:DNA-directed RNA polymerase subunit delta [Oceanobacillus manasiensis]|uniref:DNA-directed RNA polymerase subunit delta n=1 Tax=Oceanobacillus manasiensis TaxID=586413 RepID=UPI0005AA27AC|nr:DNA-directed RNA polymerase subunit delta [Oceanobacillus manasiensis]